MHWMRKRGARVRITTGKYTGQTGTVDSNVFQRTVDDPDELANGYHVMPGHWEAGYGAVGPGGGSTLAPFRNK